MPEEPTGERYELRDPFAEVTYRANTFAEMLAKAEQLGSSRFVAVAEEGNVGRAALRLHVAQPPLSRQIRALEEEIGTPLFERTPKGMTLLPPGRVFLDRARAILAALDDAVVATRAERPPQPTRVSRPPPPAPQRKRHSRSTRPG